MDDRHFGYKREFIKKAPRAMSQYRDETRRDEVTKRGDEMRSDLPVCMHAGPGTSLKYALPVEARCQCPHGGLRTLPEAT
jgi:hypothetical protein